jgi:hypothetical protein
MEQTMEQQTTEQQEAAVVTEEIVETYEVLMLGEYFPRI